MGWDINEPRVNFLLLMCGAGWGSRGGVCVEYLLHCDLVASACDDEGLPGCVLGPAILEVHSAAWLQLLRGRGRWCSLCFPFLPPLPEPLVLDGQVGTCVGVPAEVHLAGRAATAADPAAGVK